MGSESGWLRICHCYSRRSEVAVAKDHFGQCLSQLKSLGLPKEISSCPSRPAKSASGRLNQTVGMCARRKWLTKELNRLPRNSMHASSYDRGIHYMVD